MDLRLFRYFIEVADQMSFTRAANRLHISQPTLSQQIRVLERSLGADLLLRSTSGFTLTQAGIVFLERARATIREAERAVEDVRAASAGLVGRLNVVCGPMAEYCVLHDVLALAKTKLPNLRIRFRFLPESEQIHGVLNGTADVAFMGCFSPASDPHLNYEPLYSDRAIVIMPSTHRLGSRRMVRLVELAGESWILPSRDQSPFVHDLFVVECQKAGFQPKIKESADWYSRFPLVASGAGLSVGASSLIAMRRPKIKFTHLEPLITVDMGMIARKASKCPQLNDFNAIVREAVELRSGNGRVAGNFS